MKSERTSFERASSEALLFSQLWRYCRDSSETLVECMRPNIPFYKLGSRLFDLSASFGGLALFRPTYTARRFGIP
jgi:hypothetical protein